MISRLEDHIGYWLRYVSNHISHAFNKKMKAKGFMVAEWVLLRLMYENDDASPGVMAEKVGMTRGAVTKVIDKLTKKKLVTRVESSRDRRFQKIKLTKEGRNIVPVLASLADENDAHYFSHLPAQQRKDIMEFLQNMASVHQIGKMPLD